MSETSTELVPVSNLDDLARLGIWLALSESGAETEKALGASAALRLYYLEQLDLPPFAAGQLSVIKGKLFVGAELIRALAIRAGYQIDRVDDNDETATAVLSKDGKEIGRTTFTIDQARKAGLIRTRSPWETHPARMLWARASKYVVTDYAPHVALGLALDDEIVEYTGNPGDNGVTVTTTYIDPEELPASFAIPKDVQLENQRRIEDELAKHADSVDEADG